MPRNNRYNPSPAEREAQRRAATGRGQPDPDQLRPDPSWRLVSSDDSIADTWMYWGASAAGVRMRREAAERQLRDIELHNQIERAVDRIQSVFSRVSGPVGFQSAYPVALKRRNRQPDGSLLDLTQPAEATL